MKKIFCLSIILSMYLYSQNNLNETISAVNVNHDRLTKISEDTSYIPLQENNDYQYILSGFGGGTVYSYLRYGTISSDTLINNHKYYLHSIRDVNHWLRYSEEANKLYKWLNETDLVYMDFNKAPGDTFIHLDYPYPATILGGDTSLFSIAIPYKGFSVPIINGNTREFFAKGIGMFYSRSESTTSNSSYSLIMSILYDSSGNSQNFTNHFNPQISVTPITLIDSSNFKLNFTVTHEFDRSYPPGHTSMFFMESVKLEPYYSKEDSVIIMPLINANGIINYSVISTLDTLLLKGGFTFNYRIIAKDKGIIPETSYSPDSGYYKCVWNGPTGIDDQTQFPYTFSLSQNYPNPFNPSSIISYQLPKAGNVTLKVFDVLGSEIATLVNEDKAVGSYKVEFNPASSIKNPASGIYFYQLKAGEYVETKKMILIK